MIWKLAWQNVTHRKIRALASIGGVAFCILLVFMQLGIFSAAEHSADIVYQNLDFDIVLASPEYVFLVNGGSVPRETVTLARGVSGVQNVVPLHAGFTLFRSLDDGIRRSILVLGIDPSNVPLRDKEIQNQADRIQIPNTALLDREARGEYGPRDTGRRTDLGACRVDIVGNYTMGTGFIAGADAIVSADTFCQVIPGRRTDRPTLALVKVTDGRSIEDTARRLRQRLPASVRVLRKDQIESSERNYFVNIKPIGIMFRSGVIVGFLVGAVTMYQILATQVTNNIRQLATMKAVGYGDSSVYGVVIIEGFIYALIGYVPAYLGGLLLYYILREGAMVPVWMTLDRAMLVLVLTLVMCTAASVLALRKVRTADPADLFG